MTTTRLMKAEAEESADFTRQRDWFDPSQTETHVTVVGCGGIGSATAVLLSKLGVTDLTLIDGDDVELHNIPNQFFPRMMEGRSKVEATGAMCRLFGYAEPVEHKCMIEDHPEKLRDIVVTGLDSMDARKKVWEKVKESAVSVDYLIDARIGGQEIVIWTVNPKIQKEVEDYENFALFDDEEGEEAPCTARAVIDVMGFVASMITMQVRLIAGSTDMKPHRAISLTLPALEVNNWYSDTSTESSSDPLTTEIGSTSTEEVAQALE